MKRRYAILSMLAALAVAPSAGAFDLGPTVWMPDLEAGFSVGAMPMRFGLLAYSYGSASTTSDALGGRWCTSLFPPDEVSHSVELDFKATVSDEKVTFTRCGRRDETLEANFKTQLSSRGETLRSYVDRAGGRVNISRKGDGVANVVTATRDGLEVTDSASGALLRFDWNGDIVAIGEAKIIREAGRIVAIEGYGMAARFEYDGPRLRSIKNDDGLLSTISYDVAGQVSAISTAWEATYRMAYHDSGELQEIAYPDGGTTTFLYSTGTGKVATMIDRNGCFELYSRSEGHDADNFEIRAKRSCGDRWAATRVLTVNSAGGNPSYSQADTKDEFVGEADFTIIAKAR